VVTDTIDPAPDRPVSRRLPSPWVLGLAIVAGIVVVIGAARVVTNFPLGLDLLIPLQAAERWLAGEEVYVAAGFHDPEAIAPFLYPPFVLPVAAALTVLPIDLVRVIWFVVLVAFAGWTCRRLAMPWWLIPFALAWPPFAEGIWNGNIQVVLFAAFAVAFWEAPAAHDLRLRARDLDDPTRTGPAIGFAAATVGAVKISQALAWLLVARHQPRAAILGALPWVAVLVVTLPLTGIGLYGAWLGQAALAADPTWDMIGVPLLVYLPRIVVVGLTVAAVIATLWLRGPLAGAWVGLLMLLVAPNVHAFTGLFILPAMLSVRREIALLAVIGMASYTEIGWWAGVLLVTGSMLLGTRLPGLRAARPDAEPAQATTGATSGA
jgi:hypothetical protein